MEYIKRLRKSIKGHIFLSEEEKKKQEEEEKKKQQIKKLKFNKGLKKENKMKKLTSEQRKKYKEMIKQGKWNFILIRGVLFWGGIMFIYMNFFSDWKFSPETDYFMIYLNLFLSISGGLIFGLWIWNNMNKKLKEK